MSDTAASMVRAGYSSRGRLRAAHASHSLGPVIEHDIGANDDASYPKDLGELHAKLVRWFEEAERASADARAEGEKARDYKNSVQWTAAERAELNRRGQPPLTINYVSRKIDLLCGLERKARTDPKAFSRTPTEDGRADAATVALRYVADDCNLSGNRSAVYENMLVEGMGGIEIGLEDDGMGGADVTFTQIGYERIFYDPHSRALDFSDARYKGLVLWMDQDQLEEMYPDRDDDIANCFAPTAGSYDDRPGSVAWQDTTRKRSRIVQIHWSEKSDWWCATFSRSGFLADPQKSRFLDRKGKSASPLILQSAYVDRDNNRFGMVRELISLQDEINKRRSKALHLLSVNRVIAEEGAVADVDRARREVAKPDGFLVTTPGLKFEIIPGGELASGQFELLKHATEEMQASGPNASMTGNDPRELSGRAILAQQAGGAAQNEPLADNLRMFTRRLMEMSWMAVRQYWTAERWVRTTDDLNATQWTGFNHKVTLQDELAAMPDDQRAQAMQQLQIGPGDPRLQQVIRIENELHDLDVDVVIEEGIDVPSQQAETFQTLVQLAGMQPGLIPPDVLIAASGLKNKDQLLERMKQAQAQQAQAQAQQQPLIQAHAQADVAVKQAQAAANMALAKEREHAVVHGIAQVHQMHNELMNPTPPDPPSDPGTVVPPEVQAAHDMADLRAKHTAADVDQATVLHKLAQTHAVMNPPPPTPPAGG